MNRVKIGLLTIGQSPRSDGLAHDVQLVLGDAFEVIERGALDGLSDDETALLSPADGDYRLVTLLRNGTSVEIAKRHILDRLQLQIDDLEAQDVAVTLLMCTGAFPTFRHSRPLLAPQEALYGVVRALASGGRVGAVTPLASQIAQAKEKWQSMGLMDAVVVDANPYCRDPIGAIREAAARARAEGATVLFMDCFGYNLAMREAAERSFGPSVILARTLAGRLAAEIAPTPPMGAA